MATLEGVDGIAEIQRAHVKYSSLTSRRALRCITAMSQSIVRVYCFTVASCKYVTVIVIDATLKATSHFFLCSMELVWLFIYLSKDLFRHKIYLHVGIRDQFSK